MPLPLTCTQGNMKEQTMNMTKCEISQPLSRSHFPSSCWGAEKIDPLSTAFGRRVAQFLFPGNLSTFSQSKSHGSFIPLECIWKTKRLEKKNRSSYYEVNLISSTETIKSNLQWIMPRMNYLNSSCVGHLSCRHIHVLHHSSNDPHSHYSWVTGK